VEIAAGQSTVNRIALPELAVDHVVVRDPLPLDVEGWLARKDSNLRSPDL